MPIYAKDVYGGGPHTLGLLLAAAGAGALACMVYLAGRATIRGLGRVIAAAAATCGAALAAFAYLRIFPLALVLMALVGGGVILAAASANTILQTIVDDRLRGRIAGFFTMAFLGVAPLGNLAAGALAAAFGAPATLARNGLVVRAGGALVLAPAAGAGASAAADLPAARHHRRRRVRPAAGSEAPCRAARSPVRRLLARNFARRPSQPTRGCHIVPSPFRWTAARVSGAMAARDT